MHSFFLEEPCRTLCIASSSLVTTLKRRPSPSTSSLSSNSSSDRRAGIQSAKFGRAFSFWRARRSYHKSDCFSAGTQSPDAVNKLLRLSDSSHQVKHRLGQKPQHQSNTPILKSTSPLIGNNAASTGLSALGETTHQRRHHMAKMRDANQLSSESSSLNLRSGSSTMYFRSHIRTWWCPETSVDG